MNLLLLPLFQISIQVLYIAYLKKIKEKAITKVFSY